MADSGGVKKAAGARKTSARLPKAKHGAATRGKRKRSPAKLTEAEALDLIRADVLAEGDLPRREELVLTGRKLYAGWLAGRSYRSLADEFGMHPKGVENVVMEYRRAKVQVVPGPSSSLLMVHGYLDQLQNLVSDLAELAVSDSAQRQPQVKLGALKEKRETMRQQLDVWQELGWLPKHLGTLNVAMDAVAMVDTILDVMDKRGVPEDVQRELVEAVELRYSRENGRPSVDLTDAPVTIDGTAEAVA